MRRDGAIDKAVGERMRSLILKAVRERGLETPAWRKRVPADYKAFVCELFPSAKNYHIARMRFTRILRGQAYLSPKSRDYYHICYALNIDPYTAGYDIIDPGRIIKPERSDIKHFATVKRVRSTVKLHRQIIWLSSQRFRWLAIRALKARRISHEPKSKTEVYKWTGFLTYIAPIGKAKTLLMRFFEGSAILTPQNALYWRLCRALDIPPQKAAFDYKIREGVDVDRL